MANVLTVEQAAEYLQVTAETVRRGARAGRIPAARIGRRWRFVQTDLDTWLSGGGATWGKDDDLALAAEIERRRAQNSEKTPLAQAKAKWGV